MIDLQTISIGLAALSFILAVTYYSFNMRHARETRQAQLYMQFFNRFSSEENSEKALELLEAEWEDLEDFDRKYAGPQNRRLVAKRDQIFKEHDVIGYLLHKGLLDIDMVFQMNGIATTLVWNKYGALIKERRKIIGYSEYMIWFEDLAKEIEKYRKTHKIS